MGVPPWGIKELVTIISEGTLGVAEKHIKLIEDRICERFKVAYCIATDLGRQAISVALQALELREGDGVIIPSYVCRNALLPILRQGCIPQFAEINDDLNISPEGICASIDENSRAIIVPHLYSCAAQIEKIVDIARRHNLYVIDDAAQAVGATLGDRCLGTFGDVGVLSFGPFKAVSATRGGALITNDESVYRRSLRHVPSLPISRDAFLRGVKSFVKFRLRRYSFRVVNARIKSKKADPAEPVVDFSEIKPLRITALDAKLLLTQLELLEVNKKKRVLLGKEFYRMLSCFEWIELPPKSAYGSPFVKYPVKVSRGVIGSLQISRLIQFLRDQGIEAEAGYQPLHTLQISKHYDVGRLPKTEELWKRVICLPLYPNMPVAYVGYIAESMRSFESNHLAQVGS